MEARRKSGHKIKGLSRHIHRWTNKSKAKPESKKKTKTKQQHNKKVRLHSVTMAPGAPI
jgi:hypothetical protein